MKRTEWSLMENNHITLSDIHAMENALREDEIKEMERKMEEVLGSLRFGSYTDKLVAEDAFKKGYIAAHISYIKR